MTDYTAAVTDMGDTLTALTRQRDQHIKQRIELLAALTEVTNLADRLSRQVLELHNETVDLHRALREAHTYIGELTADLELPTRGETEPPPA